VVKVFRQSKIRAAEWHVVKRFKNTSQGVKKRYKITPRYVIVIQVLHIRRLVT